MKAYLSCIIYAIFALVTILSKESHARPFQFNYPAYAQKISNAASQVSARTGSAFQAMKTGIAAQVGKLQKTPLANKKTWLLAGGAGAVGGVVGYAVQNSNNNYYSPPSAPVRTNGLFDSSNSGSNQQAIVGFGTWQVAEPPVSNFTSNSATAGGAPSKSTFQQQDSTQASQGNNTPENAVASTNSVQSAIASTNSAQSKVNPCNDTETENIVQSQQIATSGDTTDATNEPCPDNSTTVDQSVSTLGAVDTATSVTDIPCDNSTMSKVGAIIQSVTASGSAPAIGAGAISGAEPNSMLLVPIVSNLNTFDALDSSSNLNR